MNKRDKGLKIADVCAEWGISKTTAYRNWRKWPHYFIGSSKTPRFNRADLEFAFSPAGREQATAPKTRSGHLVIGRSYVKSA